MAATPLLYISTDQPPQQGLLVAMGNPLEVKYASKKREAGHKALPMKSIGSSSGRLQ
jgi:hypothetical protein